jgi:ATP-dependent DNA helicase RecG
MSGEKLNPTSRKRIKTMVETNNGFEISEIDLELRGPGDLAGTKQSGVLDLKIANLAEDQSILQEARKTALEILTIDPNLASDENKLLRRHIDQTNSQISFEKIS